MTKPIAISPAAQMVIDYFRELGPRWGLKAETCAAHALLYLSGRPMSEADIAQYLHLETVDVRAAVSDLIDWRMAYRGEKGFIGASGEPWDLLFAAFEERRRRELGPALRTLASALKSASSDGTPLQTSRKIRSLLELVRDLSEIGDRVGLLPSRTIARIASIGGRISRIFGSSIG